MNLDDKKFLAEWMEYKYIDRLHVKDKRGEYVVDGREWNPYTNPEHFKEVWNKLTFMEKSVIVASMESGVMIESLINDLPKVMKYVMETIKENV